MLDIATQTCATVLIEIDDADSTEVTIALEEPKVANAQLTRTDKKKATLKWCPDANQKVSEDRVLLRLSADDGDNAKEIINYAVVLKKPAEAGCTGTAPVVEHYPEDSETVLGLDISVVVTDDVGLKSPPSSTTARPSSRRRRPGPPGAGRQAGRRSARARQRHRHPRDLRREDRQPGGRRPVGAEETVWYVVVATDNDDPNGNCDHTKVSEVYSMTVSNPAPRVSSRSASRARTTSSAAAPPTAACAWAPPARAIAPAPAPAPRRPSAAPATPARPSRSAR
jgi:hypothetical protein